MSLYQNGSVETISSINMHRDFKIAEILTLKNDTRRTQITSELLDEHKLIVVNLGLSKDFVEADLVKRESCSLHLY